MKFKTMTALALFALIAACSKDVNTMQAKSSSISSKAEVNTDDTVYFQYSGDGHTTEDSHMGKDVCFSDVFDVPSDTGIYLKAVVFSVKHSAHANLITSQVFIGTGFRGGQKNINITSDSLKFVWTNPLPLAPDSYIPDSSKWHIIALRIQAKNNGKCGEWYQAKLERAVFIRKYPKPQTQCVTAFLPQIGWKMVYRCF